LESQKTADFRVNLQIGTGGDKYLGAEDIYVTESNIYGTPMNEEGGEYWTIHKIPFTAAQTALLKPGMTAASSLLSAEQCCCTVNMLLSHYCFTGFGCCLGSGCLVVHVLYRALANHCTFAAAAAAAVTTGDLVYTASFLTPAGAKLGKTGFPIIEREFYLQNRVCNVGETPAP
jgi:hypothetical protein